MSSSQKICGNLSHGLLFVLSAPAGTGKTTLIDLLTKEFGCVVRSVSTTTRKPRANEKDGVDYFFVSEEEFQKRVASGDLLEHVTLFGYSYGSSRSHVERERAEGKHVFLVIDTQGALQLMGHVAASFIFLMPPSFEELARRLLDRGTETHESVSRRLQEAEREIGTSSAYNYVIVNDDLQLAYQALRSIVIAEEHRIR